VLRIGFERIPPNWEVISWDQFFEAFDRTGLSFFFEDAAESRICKLTKGERPSLR
jgi:hypothetical protein